MGYDSVLAVHYPTKGLLRHSIFSPPSPNSKYLFSMGIPIKILHYFVHPHYIYTSSLILQKAENQMCKERIACFPIKVTVPRIKYLVYEQ
jgi:hypothetical protein